MNQNLQQNLINLRKSKNLDVDTLAMILGVETKKYQEYEFGIAMPTAEELEKLGKFYKVDASDLFIADVVESAQPTYAPETKVKKNTVTYVKKKWLSIMILVFACVTAFCAFLPMYYNWGGISLFNILYYSIDTLMTITAVLFTLTLVWDLTDCIILFCPAKFTTGVYALISKIIRLATGILNTILLIVLIARCGGFQYLDIGLVTSILGFVAITIFKIIAFAKTKKQQ